MSGASGRKVEREHEEEIPYAKAVIIKTFQQLIDIREAGRERKNGKEFYIMSKDFCKLSYQRVPIAQKDGNEVH